MIGSMVIAAGILSGCASDQPNLIVSQVNVQVPPDALMVCNTPKITKNYSQDKQVARDFVRLYKANRQCAQNMNAIKQFLGDAQKQVKD